MIIRKKPQNPVRKVIIEALGCEEMSLQEIVDWVHSFEGVVLKDVTICSTCVAYDDYEVEAGFRRKESDVEFQVRVNAYQKKMLKYHEWYAVNKDEIEAELGRREAAHVQRAERNKERERARLEKALAKLDKK